ARTCGRDLPQLPLGRVRACACQTLAGEAVTRRDALTAQPRSPKRRTKFASALPDNEGVPLRMSFVALPFAVFGLSGAPPPPVHLLHASAPAHAKKVVFHPARTAVTHAAASTAAKHSATHAAGPAPQPVSRTPMPTPGAATVPAP